jgi:hypothetical protein
VSGGALLELTGSRTLMLLTGAGEIGLAAMALVALRSFGREPAAAEAAPVTGGVLPPALGAGGDAFGHLHLGQERADVVRGSSFWLTLLDDLRESRDDVRVELSSGVRR